MVITKNLTAEMAERFVVCAIEISVLQHPIRLLKVIYLHHSVPMVLPNDLLP